MSEPEFTGKVPPHDLDGEATVLAALMLRPDAIDDVTDLLDKGSFYSEAHQRIYEAAVALRADGETIDMVSVGSRLKASGRIAQVGGMSYLMTVINSTVAVGEKSLRTHAKALREKHVLRQLLAAAHECAGRIYVGVEEPTAFLDDFAGKVQRIAEHRDDDTMQSLAHWAGLGLREATAAKGRKGVRTGLADYDALLGGLHRGDLVIVAGRPGMGKSALAFGMGFEVARSGLGVAAWSLEMRGEDIAMRIVCGEADVSVGRVRAGELTPLDYDKITGAVAGVDALRHYYIDPAKVGIQDVRAKLRKRVRDLGKVGKKLGLVVVDYLQLMKMSASADSREQAVAEMSRELKSVAKEFDVPVMALAQLNRGVESRSDKRPMLSDLRESGSIEQDADQVILVYRDEYYDPSKHPGEAELIVAKNRHGATGTIRVAFDGKRTAFRDLEHR